MKTLILPSCIALIESTVSNPCGRGGENLNSLPSSSRKWPGPDSGGNLKESFPRWVMFKVNHVSKRKRKTPHEKNYSQSAKESRNPFSGQKNSGIA